MFAARLYATAKLPDVRLTRRLVQVASDLAATPDASIPKACGPWANTKAAYRLIENERVTVPHLTQPVAEATARLCAGRKEVFCVQDTSTLSFPSARETEGLGPVNDKNSLGLLLHPTLVLQPDGCPLGLLDIALWARDPDARGSRHDRHHKPIEEKESNKWLKGMASARAAVSQLPPEQRPRLIHVMDREGDIHDVLEDVVVHGDGAVIRCSRDRRVKTDDATTRTLATLAAATPLATETVDVPRRHNQRAREARVELRGCAVTLAPTRRHVVHQARQAVPLHVVEVKEIAAAEGCNPLHWVLWTTEPIDTPEALRRVVAIYQQRWQIEQLFRILKGGCAAEELQFKTAERMMKVLAIYLPIAVRLLQLKDAARLQPKAPCTQWLTETEWRVLVTFINKRRPAPNARPPTLRQAVLWIGRMGGHLNRKRDGMPGVKTLWLGWRDLQLLVDFQTGLETGV